METKNSLLEKVFPSLARFIAAGGIRLKWGALISVVALLIVVLISTVFILMSTGALLSANDKLCQTIAGNIASAESFITVERKPLKRSLILQDIVSNLSRSGIPGLVHAAVYDLRGMLAEKKLSYAAHTDSTLRGKAVAKGDIEEILKINAMEKEKMDFMVKGKDTTCYRYRIPFNFFKARVGVIELVFTEESILGGIHRAMFYIILIGILMVLVGVGIAYFAASAMVKPIQHLTQGVEKVGAGDLDVKLEVSTHDEIGTLTDEFNKMIDHLREKLQMQKFVSQSTISMIREKTKHGDIGLGGTRENMVFLFSDVRGFTAMSEKLKPEQVVTILNEYLDLQAQIIKKHGGDIDKFVGDEVMAAFTGDKKADNAIRAAVEIIEEIRKLNQKRSAKGERIVEVGIGLNIGDVVHGRMGSRDRMDNTSIGDTVNLAARLCSQAEGGTILVSKELISKASKKKFTGKRLEPIRVKGKSQPIEVFQITGAVE